MELDCQDMDGGWIGVMVVCAERLDIPLSAVANIWHLL